MLEAVLFVDHVGDACQAEGAIAGQPLRDRAGGKSGRPGLKASGDCFDDQWLLWLGPRRLGLGGGVPRGLGCDASGESLVGPFSVVDVVERVDLGLQLAQPVGEWLLVEVAEQRLVEAFVIALGRGLVGHVTGVVVDEPSEYFSDDDRERRAQGYKQAQPVHIRQLRGSMRSSSTGETPTTSTPAS